MGCCVSIVDPQEKELEDYYQTVTPGITLHNLHKNLVEYGTQDEPHQAIFEACSLQHSPQEPLYWTKGSFRNHITRKFPGASISDTAIDVLWSCFYFYAWHPFTRHGDADNGKLERPAFERAVNPLGVYAKWQALYMQTERRPDLAKRHSFIEDDMMDVVATTRPNPGKGIPGSGELAPTAQRLLKDKGATCHYQLNIKSLATLMSILNRVRLYKTTWGRKTFHYGTLEEPSPQQDELLNILAEQFQLSEGFLVPGAISRVFDILPNLELRFHQLWAIIFQPPVPEASPVLGTESLPDSTISDILRAVSLFVPPGTEFHGKPERARNLRPVSFETIYQSSTQESSHSLALTHIIQGITEKGNEHRPHLLLFLGDQSLGQSHTPEVIGAFYPATLKKKSDREQDMPEKPGNYEPGLPEVGPPQLLFQLHTIPRIFRFKKADEISQPSSHGTAKSHVHNLAAKYWIGDPEESEIGLEIDPATSQATFVLNQVNQGQGIYKDVLQIDKNSETSGEKLSEGIMESFTVSRVAVYRVDGGDEFDPWSSSKDGVIRRI
ncbi:hypothetical protein N7499_004727 [Penicillium canescens]|nr:hypothetical protein N7499_004727 [Penicillium canescens]KAJ6161882.1 hypothetical protein N7485_010112 [Penicillium canescens]